jgi:hypothetical protein
MWPPVLAAGGAARCATFSLFCFFQAIGHIDQLLQSQFYDQVVQAGYAWCTLMTLELAPSCSCMPSLLERRLSTFHATLQTQSENRRTRF